MRFTVRSSLKCIETLSWMEELIDSEVADGIELGEIWALYRAFSGEFRPGAPSISLTRVSYAIKRLKLRS